MDVLFLLRELAIGVVTRFVFDQIDRIIGIVAALGEARVFARDHRLSPRRALGMEMAELEDARPRDLSSA